MLKQCAISLIYSNKRIVGFPNIKKAARTRHYPSNMMPGILAFRNNRSYNISILDPKSAFCSLLVLDGNNTAFVDTPAQARTSVYCLGDKVPTIG